MTQNQTTETIAGSPYLNRPLRSQAQAIRDTIRVLKAEQRLTTDPERRAELKSDLKHLRKCLNREKTEGRG